MGQRFYIDESDLDGQLTKLDRNLWGMLDFAYIHEDMVNTIDLLMEEWFRDEYPEVYEILEDQYRDLDESDKEFYEDMDEWLSEDGRWWFDEFTKLDDDKKKLFIERYRLTISTCLHSITYNDDKLRSDIDESWVYIIGE